MLPFPFYCPSSVQFASSSLTPVTNDVYLCNSGRQVCDRGSCPAMPEVETPHMREISPSGTHGWNRKARRRAPRKYGFFQQADENGGREVWR